jgi:hypothetical protein
VLEKQSSPTLTNYHETGVYRPKSSAKFNKERIGIIFHIVGIPISIIFVSNYDLSIHFLF